MQSAQEPAPAERALARFENGDVDTLVATDVAARGIASLRHHSCDRFRLPQSDRDSYVHRTRSYRYGRVPAGLGQLPVLADIKMGAIARIARDLGLAREVQ